MDESLEVWISAQVCYWFSNMNPPSSHSCLSIMSELHCPSFRVWRHGTHLAAQLAVDKMYCYI